MYENVKKFYKNKRVFVTGHTGFKGTWLCMILERMGAIVCGYSLPKENDIFYRRSNAKTAFDYEGNILDAKYLKKAIDNFEPEILIHLASHSSLDGNYDIPAKILITNTTGVINILECIRSVNSIKSVVIVTSDKCYFNDGTDTLYTEESLLGATDPYSVSKVCQELITACYQKSFYEPDGNLGIATARACNVIGIGDFNKTRLLPYVLECFSKGKTAILRNPNAIRAWQFVLEVLWGYLLLAKKLYENSTNGIFNGAYNFGPADNQYWNVERMVKVLAKQFECPQWSFKKELDTSKKENIILKLDSRKAREILKWEPIYTLNEIMQLIGDFSVRSINGENFSELCKDWIEIFFYRLNSKN